MKNFVLRLIVTLILLYGLGAGAYALLRYPPGERPDLAGILGDYTRDLGSVFRRREPEPPPVVTSAPPPGARVEGEGRRVPPSLDDLRGEAHLSLALSRIEIPDSGRLSADASRMWDELGTIHAKTLPEAIEELGRLRTLASTDRATFERDRTAVRARLATARETLLPHTQEQPPLDAAVKLLDVLDRVDARLAGL